MEFFITGKISFNIDFDIEADTEEEALEKAKEYLNDYFHLNSKSCLYRDGEADMIIWADPYDSDEEE